MITQKRAFRDDYERPEHRSREREAIKEVIKKTDLVAHKLPKRDCLDFVLTRDDEIVCFAEVRSRSIPSTKYSEFYLPLKKFEVMRGHYANAGKQTALIYVFTDGILRTWMGKDPIDRVLFWGDSRNDELHDREPVVALGIGLFERIG